jgi:hypothetical protein
MKLAEIFWFSLLLTIIIVSCDAPHSNPLESYVVKPDTVHRIDTTYVPEEPDTVIVPPDVYVIKGFVKSQHSSPLALQNVLVSLNKNNSVRTDNQGFFAIADTQKNNGWIYFSLDNYISDSLRITWEVSDTIEINYQMNMVPVLVNETCYSIIKNDYPDHTYGSLKISGTIEDDNYSSIILVSIRNSALGFSRTISLNAEHKFDITLYETDLSLDDIDNVIGKEFSIFVRYRTREYTAGSFSISRVIRNYVEFITPASGKLVTTRNPYLEWKKINPGFSFTYTTEVYTDTINPTLIWSENNIESNNLAKRVGSQLSNGDYFWVIWIVDEFGNRSRSKPATFTIQSED